MIYQCFLYISFYRFYNFCPLTKLQTRALLLTSDYINLPWKLGIKTRHKTLVIKKHVLHSSLCFINCTTCVVYEQINSIFHLFLRQLHKHGIKQRVQYVNNKTRLGCLGTEQYHLCRRVGGWGVRNGCIPRLFLFPVLI